MYRPQITQIAMRTLSAYHDTSTSFPSILGQFCSLPPTCEIVAGSPADSKISLKFGLSDNFTWTSNSKFRTVEKYTYCTWSVAIVAEQSVRRLVHMSSSYKWIYWRG